jgi:hypothetical protein
MKISTMIAALEQLRLEHGDIEMLVLDPRSQTGREPRFEIKFTDKLFPGQFTDNKFMPGRWDEERAKRQGKKVILVEREVSK